LRLTGSHEGKAEKAHDHCFSKSMHAPTPLEVFLLLE
jgi:hypothetical protein